MTRMLSAFIVALLLGVPANADDIKPGIKALESYRVIYALDGNVKGSLTEVSRHHGGQVVRITDQKMKFLWRKETTKNRMIITGGRMLIIDEAKGIITSVPTPNYEAGMEAAMADGVTDRSAAYSEALGYVPTGATDTVLGEPCTISKGGAANAEVCITDDGIVLRVRVSKFGFDYIQTATEIRRGDGGADELFEVPEGLELVELDELENGLGG